jgi:hypothetical protein
MKSLLTFVLFVLIALNNNAQKQFYNLKLITRKIEISKWNDTTNSWKAQEIRDLPGTVVFDQCMNSFQYTDDKELLKFNVKKLFYDEYGVKYDGEAENTKGTSFQLGLTLQHNFSALILTTKKELRIKIFIQSWTHEETVNVQNKGRLTQHRIESKENKEYIWSDSLNTWIEGGNENVVSELFFKSCWNYFLNSSNKCNF